MEKENATIGNSNAYLGWSGVSQIWEIATERTKKNSLQENKDFYEADNPLIYLPIHLGFPKALETNTISFITEKSGSRALLKATSLNYKWQEPWLGGMAHWIKHHVCLHSGL